MAKQAKTAIKKSATQSAETKNWTRLIRVIKTKSNGSYSFVESMINKDKVKDYLSEMHKK